MAHDDQVEEVAPGKLRRQRHLVGHEAVASAVLPLDLRVHAPFPHAHRILRARVAVAPKDARLLRRFRRSRQSVLLGQLAHRRPARVLDVHKVRCALATEKSAAQLVLFRGVRIQGGGGRGALGGARLDVVLVPSRGGGGDALEVGGVRRLEGAECAPLVDLGARAVRQPCACTDDGLAVPSATARDLTHEAKRPFPQAGALKVPRLGFREAPDHGGASHRSGARRLADAKHHRARRQRRHLRDDQRLRRQRHRLRHIRTAGSAGRWRLRSRGRLLRGHHGVRRKWSVSCGNSMAGDGDGHPTRTPRRKLGSRTETPGHAVRSRWYLWRRLRGTERPIHGQRQRLGRPCCWFQPLKPSTDMPLAHHDGRRLLSAEVEHEHEHDAGAEYHGRETHAGQTDRTQVLHVLHYTT